MDVKSSELSISIPENSNTFPPKFQQNNFAPKNNMLDANFDSEKNSIEASMFYVSKIPDSLVHSANVKVLVVPELNLIGEISDELVQWSEDLLPNAVQDVLRNFVTIVFRPPHSADMNTLMLRIFRKFSIYERKVICC